MTNSKGQAMSDKAIYWVRGSCAATYVHSVGGPQAAAALLTDAQRLMRAGDPSHAQARLTGEAHELTAERGALGLGLVAPPTEADVADGFGRYSNGDAGVCVIDADNGVARWFAGYMAEYPELRTVALKLASDPRELEFME
jgi:hypothetical protein